MSRRSPDQKPEPGIAEVAENAELRIRVLQSRLAERETGGRKSDPVEDLEFELQKYFSAEAGRELNQLRRRVIDGVVDKILREWEQSPLENEIISRLVERIYERLAATSDSRNPGS